VHRSTILSLFLLSACGGGGQVSTAPAPAPSPEQTGPHEAEPVADRSEPAADAGLAPDAEAAEAPADPEPTATGSLSREAIQAVIRPRLSQFRYCYEKELIRDSKLAGRLDVGFTIGPDGSVIDTKTEGFPNELVAQCVAQVMMSMKFPAPKGGGQVVVSYPFIFRAEQ
jgi:outer membrane biosynthesis protein TonB